MKKSLFAIFLLLAVAVSVKAQESQTAYDFLRLPLSAHAAALGGDNVTLIEDDAFMTYMEGARMASATFSSTAGEKASWGVSAQYADYGKMKEMDENNRQTGEFSAKDIAVAGTFSYQLSECIVGGITARMVNSYIGNYSSLLAVFLPDITSRNAVARGLAERNAINAPIQGSAADIIKLAMIAVSRRLEAEKLRSRMVLQVHDELVFDVTPDERDRIVEIVKQEMEGVCALSVPLITECNYGKNWREAH